MTQNKSIVLGFCYILKYLRSVRQKPILFQSRRL